VTATSTPTATTGVRWDAWNLHLASEDQALHDRVILTVIGPAVRALPHRPWFFIRYWQGGPHLRLRVADLSDAESAWLEDELTAGVLSSGRLKPGERPLRAADYLAQATRLAEGEYGPGARPEPLRGPGLRSGRYEPEPRRYGGRPLMASTERLFGVSSRLVLAALPRVDSPRVRAALALHATLSAAAALGSEEDATEFLDRGEANWRTVLGGGPAGPGRTLPADRRAVLAHRHGPFLPWFSGLTELVGEIRDRSAMPPGQALFAHVHMLHNRLGLGLPDELQTYAALRQSHGRAATS
jgi:Lantibiotic biosynthesis dehydratase C-term